MNAVEIEEAVSRLAEAPFDADAFPFAFLEAFGNKETTLKRLRSGTSNQSDIPGGVLQRNNIHLKVCAEGQVTSTLATLRSSAATARLKAKFVLAGKLSKRKMSPMAKRSRVLTPSFRTTLVFSYRLRA